MTPDHLPNVFWALQPLNTLSRCGALKRVQFIVSGRDILRHLSNIINPKILPRVPGSSTYIEVFELLEKMSSPKTGQLSHIKRKTLDLCLGLDLLEVDQRKAFFDSVPPVVCDYIFKLWHEEFRGDLFVE
jgi:hypothetical protein